MDNFKGKKIFVAGHKGMVGSSLVRLLSKNNCNEILTVTKEEVDLRCQESTQKWMLAHRPEIVFVGAAKVGGIAANDRYPAHFLYDNLMIAANIIHSAYLVKTEKLIYLGSSCIYPKFSKQPMEESELLTGALEPTNEPYAIAKLAGIKLCQAYRKQFDVDFITCLPTNLYGQGDNFNLENSHVIPALMHRAHIARMSQEKKIKVWGSGNPRREFLHVDDCAEAVIYLMKSYSGARPVNIGVGEDITIAELTQFIVDCVGFKGEIEFDSSKPDGAPQKLLSSKTLQSMGWRPKIPLKEGLTETYKWFQENIGLKIN